MSKLLILSPSTRRLMLKSSWQIGLVFLLLTVTLNASAVTSIESAGWRFEIDNDLFFQKDNKVSSALSLQFHSEVARSWSTLKKVPDYIRNLENTFNSLTEDGLFYRTGVAIGQVIQTPNDLKRKDLITNDVPYAGVLTVQRTLYAFNDMQFYGIEFTFGAVGPLSLAEPTQKIVHTLLDSEQPKGWKNQLKTEPLLNINLMRKKKILQIPFGAQLGFDLALDGHVALGNLFTKASVGLEMRIGDNMPRGFLYVTDPIGLSMHYLANLKPANPRCASLYGSLVLRQTAFAHSILLDGNRMRNSYHVDKETRVGMIVLGLHYETADWGLHLNLLSTSRNVESPHLANIADREQLGTIDIEWRF